MTEVPVRHPRICMVGSCNVDLVARVPRTPAPGETLIGSSFKIGFGGKGANQAVMAARLGGDVTVVGRLGRDVFGEDTLRNFREQGINTDYVSFDDELSSGVAVITVDENTGQNSIVIVPGANYSLVPEGVRAAAPAIQSADVVLCQLEIRLDATLEAFRLAKTAEGRQPLTILNPAPAAELPAELLALTDIIIPNELEAAALTGLPVTTAEQAEAAARALQQRGPRNVIITLGSQGALYVEGDAPARHVAAQAVKAVDTTGAGDAFVGSLAVLLGEGRSLAQAVEQASAIATRSVLQHGTQSSFPQRAEVADILEQS
ncbi:MAG: ribokinase [Chloroflexota bacterium]